MLKPIYVENSQIPVWLSKLAPIKIEAVCFLFFVFSRGKLDPQLKRHETIHFYQQLELLFVIQWFLYFIFSIIGRFRYGSWVKAYLLNPFEAEAYNNQTKEDYLKKRKFLAWTKYII